MTIIIFIIILAVLIFVHELGHFLVAKKSGIRVDEFGLGFPPKIFSKKYGETLYTLNAIPFGGFVKIYGEDPIVEQSSLQGGPNIEERKVSFQFKPKWVQSLVLIAGITFNIIFAWLLLSLGFTIGMPTLQGYSPFGEVSNEKVVITNVLPNSPASEAGLIVGDNVLEVKVNGNLVYDLTSENISKAITTSKEGDVYISYKRGTDEIKNITITPSENIIKDSRAIGISMDQMGDLKLPIHLAFLEGARTTYFLVINTAKSLAGFLWQTITFNSDLSQVSGPVGIAGVVGQASRLGFVYLLSLTAVISINLALINLVPFPALDGGRLLFVFVESIIRRPIKPQIAQWANAVGFLLLIILMLVITTNDIVKLF